jgi:four helix bundle protein
LREAGGRQLPEGRKQKAVSRNQKAVGRRQGAAVKRRRKEPIGTSIRAEYLWYRKEGRAVTVLRGHRDLKVYQLAFDSAMQIFAASKAFPLDERYALTSQIRRSSRSVAANVAEGFRKRQYPAMFASKLADADGEVTETLVWPDFAMRCGYLSSDRHQKLMVRYEELGKMLGSMMKHPERFAPS